MGTALKPRLIAPGHGQVADLATAGDHGLWCDEPPPGVVINGEVPTGGLPSREKIETWLSAA